MAIEQVNSALVQAYQLALPNMPTQFDLFPGFKPPATGMFAMVNFVIADRYPVTLGDSGEDEVIGYLQVAVYGDNDNGISQFLRTIDSINSYFRNGRSFEFDQQQATVLRSRVTPLRSVDGRAVIVIQVSWRARIQRST